MSPLALMLLIALGQDAAAASPPAAVQSAAAQPPASGPGEEGEAAAPVATGSEAWQPPSVRPFEMPASTPGAPVPYVRPADPLPSAPVKVEAYRRSYEAPPDAREQMYQAGVQRNFDAQQVRMGSLDGEWLVRTAAGSPMMALVLNDPGGPNAELEGAWRLLGPRSRTGLLLAVRREGDALVLAWAERDNTGEVSTMRLTPQPGGAWRGVARARDVEYPVTMSRR